MLDDVQGPFNVGAIVRTAAALRVDDVWLTGRTPEPDDTKVGKTALGTQRYLSFHRSATVLEAIDAARAVGYRVVAVELADDAVALHEMALGPATCLVVGHEDRGCDRDPRRLRCRRLPPPARQGGVPQRGDGRRRRLLRGAATGLGYSPLEGSIIADTWLTRSAGNPPQRACSRMMSSSGAT